MQSNNSEITFKVGTVTKIHSNYYYVDSDNLIWECMLRNKRKKEGVEPKVGDKVEFDELNFENTTAVITSILERTNELNKPNIANIDQIVVVMSTFDPDFSPLVLDKFIVLAESNKIKPTICINKSDKITEELETFIKDTYTPLNYDLVFTSTKTNKGIDELKTILLEKISVLTGISGSGKSSIINCVDPKLNLMTSEVSKSLGSGRHTTRHVSLQKFEYQGKAGLIADTPGFSFMEFNDITSSQLAWSFKDFVPFIPECKMSMCLHSHEPDCGVKAHIDTEGSRYNNYLCILYDILELEKVSSVRSFKKEVQVKITKRADGKDIRVVKLKAEKKANSRRVVKQNLLEMKKNSSLDDFDDDN